MRVADAEHRAAEGLALQAARVDARCRRRRPPRSRGSGSAPVSTSTSTSAKPATNDCDLAVARVVVARDGHQSLAGQRRRRRLREALMSSGSSWPSYLPPSSIAFCAACAKRHAAAAARDTRRRPPDSSPGCRRASSRRSPAASSWRRSPTACAARVMRVRRLAAARDAASTAGSCRCRPRRPRTAPTARRASRRRRDARRMTECVPRLPMPDWNCTFAVRLDDEQAVEAGRAGRVRADRDAGAADLRADALAAARLLLVPVEQLGALVERFLHERARARRPAGRARSAGRTAPCPPAR